MEHIKKEQPAEFDSEEIEAGVAMVKTAVGHLDRDILNCVLMTALVENCHHHAKLSNEYKQAAVQFGHEPTWGGGQIQAKCGDYAVEVKISHNTEAVIKNLIEDALANGKNPLAVLAGLLDGNEQCDCPDCTAERNNNLKH